MPGFPHFRRTSFNLEGMRAIIPVASPFLIVNDVRKHSCRRHQGHTDGKRYSHFIFLNQR